MNQDNSHHIFEVDEEDDDWIPLSPPHRSYANQESDMNNNADISNSNTGTSSDHSTAHIHTNARTYTDTEPPSASTSASASAKPNSEPTNSNAFEGDMERIRHHHERNSSLKQHLINQPIARFPFYFLKNLASEVWASHYYIRLGMFLIICGIFTQTSSFSILFYTNLPKLLKLLLTITFLGISGTLYLQNTNTFEEWTSRLYNAISMPQSVTDAILTCLENADGRTLRRCVIGVIYVLPVMMEMMVLVFLSKLVGEAFDGWWVKSLFGCIVVGVEVVIVLPMHFDAFVKKDGDEKMEDAAGTNGGGGGIFRMKGMTLVKKPFTTLFDCRLHLWASLYTIALMTALFRVKENQAYKPMLLAGPFLLVSGALLVLSATEGEEGEKLIMNLVRRVLRRTLGGILMELGEEVKEDEMLQLLMLRWIVDYWASDSTPKDNSADTDRGEPKRSAAASARSFTSSSHGSRDASSEGASGSNNTVPSPRAQAQAYARETSQNWSRGRPLGWEELFSMLSLTTDQMHKEVDADRGGGRNNRRQEQTYKNESLTSLQAMLLSFNANERARPAVMSYKVAVEELPPSRKVAIYVSLARRCPAVLSAIYLFLFDPAHANPCIIVLLPLMMLDAMKVSQWITACQKFGESQLLRSEMHTPATHECETSHWLTNIVPATMSPMEILLNEDHNSLYPRRTALRVWYNVQSSVSALDLGLTAMKCAETAQVATKLTFNVISLASFAAEMKNEGLGVGLRMLLLDLFHFHLEKTSPTSQQDGRSQHRSKYSHAALDLVENSQMLQRNVHELLDVGSNSTFFSPVLSVFQGIFGEKGEEPNSAPDANGKDETDDSSHMKYAKKDPKTQDTNNYTGTEEHVMTSSVPEDLELDENNGSWTEIETHLNRNLSTDREDIADGNEAKDEKNSATQSTDTHHAIIEESNDHLKWIGAGVALIGTVIGGIALANNNKDSSHDKKEKRSTVTIERLDDEED